MGVLSVRLDDELEDKLNFLMKRVDLPRRVEYIHRLINALSHGVERKSKKVKVKR